MMPPKDGPGKRTGTKIGHTEGAKVSDNSPGDTAQSGSAKKTKIKSSSSLKNNNTMGGDQATKLDTRTLITGSKSWTGKLPVNLLSELCQRKRWEKPDYSMVFCSIVRQASVVR